MSCSNWRAISMHVRKPPSSARNLISWRTSCRMLSCRAIVAQGCVGWERASANRSLRRVLERHRSRVGSPAPLPGWCGGDQGRRGMASGGSPQYLRPGHCGRGIPGRRAVPRARGRFRRGARRPPAARDRLRRAAGRPRVRRRRGPARSRRGPARYRPAGRPVALPPLVAPHPACACSRAASASLMRACAQARACSIASRISARTRSRWVAAVSRSWASRA